jgi:ABC-type sugar transport system ATPase subunit
MSRLELRDVSVTLGGKLVLEHVSLSAEEGEFLVLVGPSGCGKSTLLRVIAGLLSADSGEVHLDGERVDEREPKERDVAMVFQNYALYPHKTVRKNLAFPLEVARVAKDEIARRVEQTAASLGLTELLDRKPATLSGGQMQRTALGRAIIRNPRLFLFDEPLSNLDAKLRGEMRAEIVRLHQRLGITTIYVTHDQAEAMTMGTRIAVLEAGRVRQIGPPLEVFDRPAATFVATFIGSPAMNLVRGAVSGGEFALGPFRVPCPGVEKGDVMLGLRPQQLAVRRPSAPGVERARAFRARVLRVEELGSGALIEVELDGQRLLAASEGRSELAQGDEVELEPTAAPHWFDAATGARLES